MSKFATVMLGKASAINVRNQVLENPQNHSVGFLFRNHSTSPYSFTKHMKLLSYFYFGYDKKLNVFIQFSNAILPSSWGQFLHAFRDLHPYNL